MWNWISKTEDLRRSATPFVLVTVVQNVGSTPSQLGAKMVVQEQGRLSGTIGGGNLEFLALEDAQKALKQGVSTKIRYPLGAKTGQCCGGVVELFFEVINGGPMLYLFGAGHVGQAVCRTLEGTPFTVHLVDPREEWVHSERVPREVIRHCKEWDEFVEEVPWNSNRTYAVIMTFRHDTDQFILEDILKKKRPVRYLGLIGSRGKWERFKQRLSSRALDLDDFSHVRCPIGIPVGGKAPQEIAISLSAELLKTHYEL